MNYYNEIDPFCCEWIENLMIAGEIPLGKIDSRSILEVTPKDLEGFNQLHFFAGVAGWSLALRLAQWHPDEPIITASCPCQSFSSAGKQKGFDDPRDLWPAFFKLVRPRLIEQPQPIIGEQVGAAIKHGWLDRVYDDLEGIGYTPAAAVLPACGVGAPHIRSRLYWVADADESLLSGLTSAGDESDYRADEGSGRLANDLGARYEGTGKGRVGRLGQAGFAESSGSGAGRGLAQPDGGRISGGDQRGPGASGKQVGQQEDGASASDELGDGREDVLEIGPWSYFRILNCTDGKSRRTGVGVFPLAHGLPRSLGAMQPGLLGLAELAGLDAANLKSAKTNRLGRLKGMGNAIVPVLAAQFIMAFREAREDAAALSDLL